MAYRFADYTEEHLDGTFLMFNQSISAVKESLARKLASSSADSDGEVARTIMKDPFQARNKRIPESGISVVRGLGRLLCLPFSLPKDWCQCERYTSHPMEALQDRVSKISDRN